MDQSVQSLTTALAAGDTAAVERFYRQYFDTLYAMARRATRRDEAFCLDVVQESVLRIVRSVRAVNCDRRFAAWLRLVVQSTAYDMLRSEARRQKRESARAMPEATGAPTSHDGCQIDWLKRQIDALDPHLARLIDLRYTRQWTLNRIASALGLSVGAVDGRLRRVLELLRQRAVEDLHD